MKRKIIRNERGELPFLTIFIILAVNMLLAFLLLLASVKINCINIRNAVKMELNNVSARIYADTFHLEDRTLLRCLFEAVQSVITRMFHKHNKSELFTPGFICVLHTFGRDLKWNPHIDCLIYEDDRGFTRTI